MNQSPSSSKKIDSVIIPFSRSYGHHGYSCKNKNNAPAYVSKKLLFAYYNTKHITDIPKNPTGWTAIER